MAAPSTTTPSPALDHIVILVPHETLQNLPSWLTTAFTISPGGRHADGVTENKLILLQDGVYLELIAFVPGQDVGRASHRWGARREGHIIDWANTLLVGGGKDEDALEGVRARVKAAETGIVYETPLPGGRVRAPDGVELKWVTCSPRIVQSSSSSSPEEEEEEGEGEDEKSSFVGGEAPFWCLDRTPRGLRVPYQGEGTESARHPCGVLGVRDILVAVGEERLFRMLKATYDALQGEEGKKSTSGEEGFSWNLHVPEIDGDKAGEKKRTLSLIKIEEEAGARKGKKDVYVKLSLFTSASSTRIGGKLGNEDWMMEFDLVGS